MKSEEVVSMKILVTQALYSKVTLDVMTIYGLSLGI